MIGGSEEFGKAFKLRWDITWRALGALPQPATTFDELVAAYSESGRFYHTRISIRQSDSLAFPQRLRLLSGFTMQFTTLGEMTTKKVALRGPQMWYAILVCLQKSLNE